MRLEELNPNKSVRLDELNEPDVSTFDTFDDETKAKINNSFIYSSLSGSDPNDVFGFTDNINQEIYGNPSNVSALAKSKKTYEDTKSWIKTIKDGYDNAGVGMVKGLAGTTLAMAELNKKLWNAIGRKRPQIIETIANNSEEWSNMMLDGTNQYYQENPDKMIELDPELGLVDTLKEYATRPKVLIQSLIESAPLMLEAGLGTLAGGPAGGITAMATPRAGEVYANARKEGTDVLPAYGQAVLTGSIEAGIEEWTFGKKLGIAKNMTKYIEKGLPKILWEGTKAFFRGSAEEGSQQFNENFWRWMFTDRTQSLTEGVGQATGAGGITELAMAGVFGTAGLTMGNAKPVQQQQQMLNKLERQVIDSTTLTPEQKAEIKVELDKVRKDVTDGKYAPTGTPDISGSVDFANRQNLPEEIPNVTEEEFQKALGLSEASTTSEQNQGDQTANQTVSQESGQVTQETKPSDMTTPTVKENLTTETPVSESKTQEVSNVNTLQRDILGGENPAFVLGQNLKKAKELVPVIKSEQDVTKKERFQKMRDVANELINKQGLTPSQALNIARIQLSGEQTTYQGRYESIRERLEQSSPGTVAALETAIWNNPQLQLMDKDTLIRALNKLIDGHYLQKAEIKKIRDFFGNELGDIAGTRIKNVPWYEQIVEWWRAMLLTGLKTSGLNMSANLGNAITETASDNVAAGIDAFISKVKGSDRTIAATVRGEVKGFMKKGIPEFKYYMKTGVDNRKINSKWDFTERSYGNGKWAKKRLAIVNTIFHLMGAEDMLCYYAAEGRSYYNQALAKGMNEGLKGKELTDYADKLADKPTERMIEIAMYDSEMSVFMNRTILGDIAAQLQEIPVIGKILIPFSRTPAAVAMQIVNYTPVGVTKEIIQQIHRGSFDQRKFSQAFGRSVVGTATMVIGAELLKAGLITLGYPKGERERKLWEVEGRKPLSIKVPRLATYAFNKARGKNPELQYAWRSIYTLGPAGNILIVGGYFQQAYQETGSPTEAMTVALSGGAKSIAEATFLRGLNQALAAVSDPETSWSRWFSDMAGSAVPTLVADVARMTDTTERRAEGPIQKIQNRLPLLREMLQPKLDVFGQDLPRYGGNPLEVMIDPTRPVKINQDLVVDELRRLWDENIKVSPTLLGDRMGYDVLTDEENTLLWRMAGRYTYSGLFSMIMSSDYKTSTDEEKGKMIDDLVKTAKDLARAQISMSKMSEGFTETELRKDGLLTNDVKKLIGD